MHNIQRLISVIMLFFAAFSMVASSALPHHHHDDGSICIAIGSESDAAETENHSSGEGCSDDCAMNIDLLQDASQLGHASKVGFIPTLVVTLSWDYALLPEPQESNHTTSFIYIERGCNGIVCSPCGLRAPPYMA